MKISPSLSTPLRWTALLPAALLAAAVAQVLVFAPVLWGVALSLGHEPTWLRWVTKIFASPVMAAAFVSAAVWCAPTYRRVVALGALAVTIAWGALLIATGPTWGPVMGGLGITGGAAAAWWSWKTTL